MSELQGKGNASEYIFSRPKKVKKMRALVILLYGIIKLIEALGLFACYILIPIFIVLSVLDLLGVISFNYWYLLLIISPIVARFTFMGIAHLCRLKYEEQYEDEEDERKREQRND